MFYSTYHLVNISYWKNGKPGKAVSSVNETKAVSSVSVDGIKAVSSVNGTKAMSSVSVDGTKAVSSVITSHFYFQNSLCRREKILSRIVYCLNMYSVIHAVIQFINVYIYCIKLNIVCLIAVIAHGCITYIQNFSYL